MIFYLVSYLQDNEWRVSDKRFLSHGEASDWINARLEASVKAGIPNTTWQVLQCTTVEHLRWTRDGGGL